MEEKKITLKELDAYICIATFYIAKEQQLDDEERGALARLAKDFYTHIYDHVTGKNPFEKEDLDKFYQIHERVDFLKNVIRNIIN